ncbi:MAG: TatD family hydrolase [Clostridia bacterium]|nr:TatD family hydrolase [Clostridia bacterium]
MIDTHAHLLSVDTEKVISTMANNNLEAIVNIGTTIDDSTRGLALAKKYKNIYQVVGIYPEYSDGVTDEDLQKIEELAKDEKVVAIGEIGLDYHGEKFDKKKQKEIFVKQLEIANKLNLPFCIHCRAAVDELYDILFEHKNLINHSGLMHCYSEGSEWFQKFLDLGMFISLSGNITYKKSDKAFLKSLPLDRILVETDSPYLSPQVVRGKPNEPANVRYVLDFISKEIGISYEELEKITTKNAKKFYGIKD